jgi:uracil DNA glycosylase
MPTSGNLSSWAKQGVLFNASLSVRKDAANSLNLQWSVYRYRN